MITCRGTRLASNTGTTADTRIAVVPEGEAIFPGSTSSMIHNIRETAPALLPLRFGKSLRQSRTASTSMTGFMPLSRASRADRTLLVIFRQCSEPVA